MNERDFRDAMLYLMKSKGRNLENDMLTVWYKILVEETKLTSEMINYAVRVLVRSDNNFPTCNDILQAVNPMQDPKQKAFEQLHRCIDEQTNGVPDQDSLLLFFQLFTIRNYFDIIPFEKISFEHHRFITQYLLQYNDKVRVKQLDKVKQFMIGDGNG